LRIALFGGTFDPIHDAHIAIACAAQERFALDRVLIIPAANPPHKTGKPTAPYADRLRMVELACVGRPGLEGSPLERGDEASYSIQTIERVRSELGSEAGLYFLIGADAFAEVRTWFRWRDVIAAVDFIVVSRPGHTYDAPAGARVHKLDNVALPVSSSSIRERLARGEQPGEVSPAVFEYIRANGLYGFSRRR
jgi:nicotinate-nucleotide adenylyltransferase